MQRPPPFSPEGVTVTESGSPAIAIAAEAEFDASGGAGSGASLTFVGVAGDLVVHVPPGSRLRESGFNLLGDRKIELAPGDGPEIRIKVYGLFSDVKITDRPR